MKLNKFIEYYDLLKKHGMRKLIALARNKILRKFKLPSHLKGFPDSLLIEISTLCNLNCEYCVLRTNMPDKKLMEPEVFTLLKPYFRYFGSILLSGLAEPLMNNHLCEYISIIKTQSKDCKVEITTNATLLNEKSIMNLIDSGLDHLSFSIDGGNPEIVDNIRIGSKVNNILQNINLMQNIKKNLKKKNPEISATTVLQKKNYQLLPNLVNILADMGIKNLNVNGLEPYSKQLMKNVLWDLEAMPHDLSNSLKKSIEIAEQKNINLRLASFIPDAPICRDINIPIVLANGDVVPCSVLAYERDYFFSINNNYEVKKTVKGRSKRLIFGNIRKTKFENIWFSEDYINFRARVQKQDFPDECRHCLIKHQFICVRSEKRPRKILDQLVNQ